MRRVASSIGPFAFAHLWKWRRANEVTVLFHREQMPARVLGRISLKVALKVVLNVTYHGVEHGSEHDSEYESELGHGR